MGDNPAKHMVSVCVCGCVCVCVCVCVCMCAHGLAHTPEQQRGKGVQAVDGHSPNSIILLDAKFKIYATRLDCRLLGI